MNRLSAAMTAFLNPEKLPITFTTMEMDPGEPIPLTENQIEEEKRDTQYILNRFIEVMNNLPYERGKRIIDYGYKLLEECCPDRQTYLHYSMLWPLFYAGCTIGADNAWRQFCAIQGEKD